MSKSAVVGILHGHWRPNFHLGLLTIAFAIITGAALGYGAVTLTSSPALGVYANLLVLWTVPLFVIGRALIFTKRYDIFEAGTIFLIFYFLNFSVPALILIINPNAAIYSAYWEEAVLERGLLYANLALALFLFGYYGFRRLGRVLSHVILPRFSPRYSVRRLQAALAVIFMTTAASFVFWLERAGSLPTLIFERGIRVEFGLGFLQPISNLRVYFLPLAYVYLFRQGIRGGLLFVVPSAMVLGISIVSVSRGSIFLWLFVLIVAGRFLYNWRITPKLAIVFLVVFLAVSNLQLAARSGAFRHTSFSLDAYSKTFLSGFLFSFSNMESLLSVLNHFPERQPHYMGRTIWESLTLPAIPRILWPEKPLVYGHDRIWEDIGGFVTSGTQHQPSLPGTLYANFGVLGIVIGMLAIGMIFRAVYSWLLRDSRNPAFALLYAAIVFFLTGNVGAPLDLYAILAWLLPLALVLAFVHGFALRSARLP